MQVIDLPLSIANSHTDKVKLIPVHSLSDGVGGKYEMEKSSSSASAVIVVLISLHKRLLLHHRDKQLTLKL